MKTAVITITILGLAIVASAHVSVSPRESKAGVAQKYLVRVPTEGKVTTVSVDVEIPEDVVVSDISAPAGQSRSNLATWLSFPLQPPIPSAVPRSPGKHISTLRTAPRPIGRPPAASLIQRA
jgi:hypothetical protein